MTRLEVSERYHISIELLENYEKWNVDNLPLQKVGDWQYDSCDIDRLSLIVSLLEIGFNNIEIQKYMRLLLSKQDTSKERLEMLENKRGLTLDEIHFKENQIMQIDYLRHQINKAM